MEGAQDLQDWLGTKRGEFDWNIEQQNRAAQEAQANRALGAVGPAMQFGQMPTQEAKARLGGRSDVFAFAGAEQAQQQAQINTAIQKFAEENQAQSRPSSRPRLIPLSRNLPKRIELQVLRTCRYYFHF
jgi:hypothetical protein